MIRGTDALFKFKLPYTKEELAWATMKFWQPNNTHPYLPITKKLEHCDTSDNPMELCVSLTADETMRFSDEYKAKVQLRAQHAESGTVFGSRPQLFTVYPMNDEILEEDPTLPAENEEDWIILDGEVITT
jgi:hypothetical protein